ncbi:terminase family protein [bacterium]|nr:terminase family protein [bacterium]
MSWEIGTQKTRRAKEDINKILLETEGLLDEKEAKILLYKFLRENTTFSTNLIAGVDLFPFQHIAIKSMFESDYFLGIWSRGMSKSWTTGIFAFMDAIMNQGVEIGILSKSFRQAKMIFKKIEDIAAKPEAKYLANCITRTSKQNDEWVMEIGSSSIRALPLGDGSKLRGFRFHRIIIDEMLLMPERIYNEVIVPFLSVVQNPKEREDLYNLETQLIKLGKMKEGERFKWPNNKLIMLSSASYKFEYLYKLYENFEMLITQDNQEKNNASRTIMQFSYDCAPKQLFDENLIEQARSTMSQSQYDREFGAIFTDDSSGYFKISKMQECTVPEGSSPSVEVKGEEGSDYILSFDPSWAESESSDDFAMQVFKLNKETGHGTLVHVYAMAGQSLKNHILYFHYLLTNFNIVSIVGDYNGGVQFINAVKESSLFKKSKILINIIEAEFDNLENYQKSLRKAKTEFKKDGTPCFLRKPTSDWIRRANELLQANFDHKRIWFASRAINDSFQEQRKKRIPIQSLKFLNFADDEEKQSDGAKMIDLVEHQQDMMDYTKGQCALIEVKSNPQGTQTFDLPLNLKRTSGPSKARKDCYSALLLGSWVIKVYNDINSHKEEVVSSFVPIFIK